ncbi:MAG: HAMP domain-containing protein [Candidatus Omnitrophica bacterium]|nr:HAMP domain-containing protein [Candidatus Omnitrophota bacterium]
MPARYVSSPLYSSLRGKRVYISLTVAIPLTIAALVFGYGIIYLGVFDSFVSSGAAPAGAAELARAMDRLKTLLISSLFISLIIGAGLAYGITLPLRHMITAAERVSGGDLTQTLGMLRTDEIGSVGAAFDEILVSVNRHILQGLGSGFLSLNQKGRVVAMNPTTARLILGADSQSAVGKKISEVFPKIQENAPFYEVLDWAMKGGRVNKSSDMTLHTAEGRSVSVKLNTALLKREDDTVVGVAIHLKDLNELEEENRRMASLDKLVGLGELAANLAHEIRNPLGSIKGFVELIGEDMPEDAPNRRYVGLLLKEVDRVNLLVERLLRLSRPEPEEKVHEALDLHKLLDHCLLLAGLKELGKERISIVREYKQEAAKLYGNLDLLQQAFLNIVLNAAHAMPDGGILTLKTRAIDEGAKAQVEIRDTGFGIPAERLDKIFEPFFSTRTGGTGLGLAIAQRNVNHHGGEIQVTSVEGQGTNFTVTLPLQSQNKG